eukprot:GFKZ01003527.1.p3 GENE.GFKZ01003527.1~~GFKZ01003527.1.p3  ORF type:complete len:128 (+),score=10.93 GFKZ01003527.1:1865-2248(+)
MSTLGREWGYWWRSAFFGECGGSRGCSEGVGGLGWWGCSGGLWVGWIEFLVDGVEFRPNYGEGVQEEVTGACVEGKFGAPFPGGMNGGEVVEEGCVAVVTGAVVTRGEVEWVVTGWESADACGFHLL